MRRVDSLKWIGWKGDRPQRGVFFQAHHLPVNQTLIWCGPLFWRLAPKK